MENINGFLVVGDIWINNNNCYRCDALCKICKNQFETNYHSLHRMKSCGCGRPRQLKPLPENINGFRIIKCYGYNTLKKNGRWALVECKVCKREYEVDPNQLKYRKHCGCMKKNVIACKYVKSHPQLAQTIKHMLARCYNKNNQDYYNYGARGIIVCDQWKNDRNTFCEWSLLNGYENDKGLSIDRINSNGNYDPNNCKWSTPVEQGQNTRRNVMTIEKAKEIRELHKKMKLSDIALKFGISYGTARNVVNNISWKE